MEYSTTDVFNLSIPKGVSGVPSEILDPSQAWADKNAYKVTANSLAEAFIKNFDKFKEESSKRFTSAGPTLTK